MIPLTYWGNYDKRYMRNSAGAADPRPDPNDPTHKLTRRATIDGIPWLNSYPKRFGACSYSAAKPESAVAGAASDQ
ncbi:MAG: hypothetical protein U1A72_22955 [Sulfuritalea sp.]|nr:hypothetical protein [Sulfuritalea sp.]